MTRSLADISKVRKLAADADPVAAHEAEKDACREQRRHRIDAVSAQVIDIATKKTHVTPKVLSAKELGIEPPAIRWRFAADGSKIYERIRSVRDEPAGQS
jgi:hypothetical protein